MPAARSSIVRSAPRPGRRRRASVAVGLLVVVASTWILAACSGANHEADPYPGFTSTSTTQDSTPFTLAEPSNADPSTTIPPGGLGESTTQATFPGWIPPDTTTTTIRNGPPGVRDPSSIVSLCGFQRDIGPFENIVSEPSGRTASLMAGLVAMVRRYREVAPASVQPSLDAIANDFESLRLVLVANHEDPRSAAFQRQIQEIGRTATQPGSLGSQLNYVVAEEQLRCSSR